MKVLITGGCGFVGANLIRYLIDKSYHIRVLDNLSSGNEENLRKSHNEDFHLNDIELVIGDIRDIDKVIQAIKGVDAVVHLAAYTSVVESLENPRENWDINVNGTLNLLEACRQNGVNSFIFASSNAVVGEQEPPIDEMMITRPLSPYGASKLACEALCLCYYNSFGLKTVSLRFANCYGPFSNHKTSVVNEFINRANEGKQLVVYGDGNQTRDFIYVEDVCQAIYLALTAKNFVFGEVFQIASGKETTINKLAELMQDVIGTNLQITYETERTGEIKRNYSNIAKAKKVLGFNPQVELRQGLQRLCDNMKKATL